MTKRSPFRYFKTSPEIIRLAVMLYIRYPLALRNVEDLLHERGNDGSHETVRFWWNRFGPMFAAEIRRRRVDRMRPFSHWRWHLDEVFVRINGVTHYLWRAVDHEGEVLEAYTIEEGAKIRMEPGNLQIPAQLSDAVASDWMEHPRYRPQADAQYAEVWAIESLTGRFRITWSITFAVRAVCFEPPELAYSDGNFLRILATPASSRCPFPQ